MRTLATAVLAGLTSAKVLSQTDFDFVQYIAKHGKSYASLEEFNLRSALFHKFDSEINFHNQTERTSVHGHNFISDMTEEEKKNDPIKTAETVRDLRKDIQEDHWVTFQEKKKDLIEEIKDIEGSDI